MRNKYINIFISIICIFGISQLASCGVDENQNSYGISSSQEDVSSEAHSISAVSSMASSTLHSSTVSSTMPSKTQSSIASSTTQSSNIASSKTQSSIISSIVSASSTTQSSSITNYELDDIKDTNLKSYFDTMINQTTSYIPSWNKESFKGRWNYIDGVFLKSIISIYNKTNEVKYIEFVKNYVDYYIDDNGNFLNLKEEVTQAGYNSGELDTVCESKILFDLYDYTKDVKYFNAIEYTYDDLMNNQLKLDDGICFAHKKSYPNQVWLDGFYMYAPFLARYAYTFNQVDLYELIYNQYKYVKEHMYDNDKKLYYHGYSYSDIFWRKDNNCSENFWLRSMGWFLASLVDTIEYFNDSNYKYYLKEMYVEAVDGILNYIDQDSNMFYQIIDKGSISKLVSYDNYLQYLNKNYKKDTLLTNYLESSGSSLISYSILKGYNINLIDYNYFKIGFDIFNGVYNHSFINNELKDICITAGLGPDGRYYRDGSIDYYLAEPVGSNDAKGVGPFIMAYLEII